MKSFKDFLIEAKENISHKLVDMKIINEMATLAAKSDGVGFIARIYSNDHEPAHMHILDYNNKKLAKVLLSGNTPSKINDFQFLDGELDRDMLKKLLKWAKGNNEEGFNNWIYSFSVWKSEHK